LKLIEGLENPEALSRLSKHHVSTRTVRRVLATVLARQKKQFYSREAWEQWRLAGRPKNPEALPKLGSYHVSTRGTVTPSARVPQRRSNVKNIGFEIAAILVTAQPRENNCLRDFLSALFLPPHALPSTREDGVRGRSAPPNPRPLLPPYGFALDVAVKQGGGPRRFAGAV
jgi:hypothetical protein